MEEFGTYRNLEVWKKSVELVRAVYSLLKRFPADERYALTDQVRRAVISVPSNIAEGNGRNSNRDYAHFLSIAKGSLFEVMNQLNIAVTLGYIERKEIPEDLAIEIKKMLFAMIRKYE